MTKIQIYDPPVCCSHSLTGDGADTALIEFNGCLPFLESEGCAVERYNLAEHTNAYDENAAVIRALEEEGPACLPMVFVDGQLVASGKYPSAQQLRERVGRQGAITMGAAPAVPGL